MAANQVFWNETRDIALIIAGECFPDSDVHLSLRRTGHAVGASAGDWLVHLYEERGGAFFTTLNGHFSGLLIDLRTQKAFLFNDRYGIERLYWHETEDATYFASEAKALLRILPELRHLDDEGLAQFITFGCTQEWKTLFRGIQLAPGGSLWTITQGRCDKHQYFTPSDWEQQTPLGEAAFEAQLTQTFHNILPRYFASSSPIGISLTGGLDTRMIMAILPQSKATPICYTYAGVTGDTLDVKMACRVAQACGLNHQQIRVGTSFFTSFGDLVDRTAYLTDGCFGAMGAHEVYLSKLAREFSPVRLAGVFGSEILRGVSTFKRVPMTTALLQPCVQTIAHADLAHSSSHYHPVTFAAFREIPWSIYGSITSCRSQLTLRTPFLDNAVVALAYRAPPHLRNSSRSTIRFIRHSGHRCATISTDRGQLGAASTRLFRRLIAELTFKLDYYYNEGMPQPLTRLDSAFHAINRIIPLFEHHKYLHYRQWFRNELSYILRDAVIQARDSSLLNVLEVKRMVDEHISGTRNRVLDINAVLTLLAIEKRLLRGYS